MRQSGLKFEFWLELPWLGSKGIRQYIASHWNFRYTAHILHCHSPVLVLSIQSKTWLSFLSSLAEWAQNSNFITTTGSWLGGSQVRPIGLYNHIQFNSSSLWTPLWLASCPQEQHCCLARSKKEKNKYVALQFPLYF